MYLFKLVGLWFFFLNMYPGVRLLNHVLVLILVFYCFEEPSHGFL